MDCFNKAMGEYESFSRDLHKKAAAGNIPVAGTIEITDRCNLSCIHCFVRSHSQTDHMTANQWKNIIDQAVDMGMLWLCVTGGEPLIRKDFFDIYEHAKKSGLLVTLFTNGLALSPSVAERLADYPPFLVEVSLYGANPGTYESITGSAEACKMVLKGVDRLCSKGIKVSLKSLILRRNRSEIWEMKALADSMGLDFRFDAMVHPTLGEVVWDKGLRLSPEDILLIDMEHEEKREAWLKVARGRPVQCLDNGKLFNCGAGTTDLYVDSGGFLRSCALYRGLGYDLKGLGLREAWLDMTRTVKMKTRTKESVCADCSLTALCGVCPAWSFLETGDEEEIPEYLCKVGQLRAEALGRIDQARQVRQRSIVSTH